MELNHFTETATVLNADCDFHRKLKPSALFRYVEQAAADHVEKIPIRIGDDPEF